MTRFDEASDDELVAWARDEGHGDTRSFETLMLRHQGFVAANCRTITRSPTDAEDLAQEVFVKAFFGLRRFEGRAQFRTWLQRIKVNHCLNFVRKRSGMTTVDVTDATSEEHAALHVEPRMHLALEAATDRERIIGVLDTMSDALRVPLMLRDGDGQSYEEIAAHLGIGLSAVKMRIKRAREVFRERFATASAGGGRMEHA